MGSVGSWSPDCGEGSGPTMTTLVSASSTDFNFNFLVVTRAHIICYMTMHAIIV